MSITRRDLLVGVPSLAAGFALSEVRAAPSEPTPKNALRIAHLTDIHIRPGRLPEQSAAKAIQQAQEQGAQLIVNGGDVIFDALQLQAGQSQRQWDLFQQVVVKNCSVPILNVLGNHDIDGWATPARDRSRKTAALEKLGLERGYYSLEKAGWKLIVLDSIAWGPNQEMSYFGHLGEEQMAWLERELEGNQLPCCLISHIPILTACGFFDGPNERHDSWRMPGQWMHLDARAIKDILKKHPEVKLCLSGHIHLADRLDYLGVTYLCNGAVCGNYWRGAYQEFAPAYALVDLYADGTFEHQMTTYL